MNVNRKAGINGNSGIYSITGLTRDQVERIKESVGTERNALVAATDAQERDGLEPTSGRLARIKGLEDLLQGLRDGVKKYS